MDETGMRNLLSIIILTIVFSTAQLKAEEQQSAFVDCMELKVKEVFQPPDNVIPMLKLQAQITERDYAELARGVNKSPTILADLELSLERSKTPRDQDAVMMKEITRQCSKYINWN